MTKTKKNELLKRNVSTVLLAVFQNVKQVLHKFTNNYFNRMLTKKT